METPSAPADQKPTTGMKVQFLAHPDAPPLDADVTEVHADVSVNLDVMLPDGTRRAERNVFLEGSVIAGDTRGWRWPRA
jgi:hypothetical protein